MKKVYLFTGIETYTWGLKEWQFAIDFCHAHAIDGLQIKIYEITQGEWYTHILGGVQSVVNFIEDQGLDCVTYGFYYGNDSATENLYILRYLDMFKRHCLNMESSWDSNKNGGIAYLVNALKQHPGELWISTWANPAQHGWVSNIVQLDKLVAVWQPEEYYDALIDSRLVQFPDTGVSGKIYPTYAVGQVSIDKIELTDCPSIWEYQDALKNVSWVDQFVHHIKQGGVSVPTKAWFQYDIVVPFGDTGFDVQLGGAHDTDLGAPANSPVTALLSGVVSSITAPLWGKQVGVKLDTPYKSMKDGQLLGTVDYCAYLHLSAVNPSLHVGSHVNVGDLIGWVGGANNESQYAGTSNPTGQNFLNDGFNSSRVQAGFALMDGPEYGGAGWVKFPPIDWRLNPTPIIDAARKGVPPPVPVPSTDDAASKQFRDVWMASLSKARPDTGIYHALLKVHKTLNIGTPATQEIDTVDWSNKPIKYQDFTSCYHVEYGTDGMTRIYDQSNHLVMTV